MQDFLCRRFLKYNTTVWLTTPNNNNKQEIVLVLWEITLEEFEEKNPFYITIIVLQDS